MKLIRLLALVLVFAGCSKHGQIVSTTTNSRGEATSGQCSDDNGKTWWPAAINEDGVVACFEVDKPKP